MTRPFRPFTPAEGPAWLSRFADSVAGLFRQIMPAPLRLKEFATADLPTASEYVQGLVYDTDNDAPSYSDGSSWIRLAAHDADVAAVAGLSTTGVIVRTGAGTAATRTFTAPAAGISITNADGVSGNPTLALADDLAAVEGLSGTGLTVRTAADSWTNRTITGTANEITVADGDGVSGNPTLSLPSALTFTGKTVTGGDYTAVTSIATLDGGGNPVLTVGDDVVVGGNYSGAATLIMQSFAPAILLQDVNTSGSASQAFISFRDNLNVEQGYIKWNVNANGLMEIAGTSIISLINSTIRFPNITTTASAANAFLDSGASNRLFRSTSARKYKTDIAPLGDEAARLLLGLEPVTYRSLAGTDDPERSHWGFIADDVAKILPTLVHFDGEGEPDGMQYERVVVGLISLVKRLEARVSSLENGVAGV